MLFPSSLKDDQGSEKWPNHPSNSNRTDGYEPPTHFFLLSLHTNKGMGSREAHDLFIVCTLNK